MFSKVKVSYSRLEASSMWPGEVLQHYKALFIEGKYQAWPRRVRRGNIKTGSLKAETICISCGFSHWTASALCDVRMATHLEISTSCHVNQSSHTGHPVVDNRCLIPPVYTCVCAVLINPFLTSFLITRLYEFLSHIFTRSRRSKYRCSFSYSLPCFLSVDACNNTLFFLYLVCGVNQ